LRANLFLPRETAVGEIKTGKGGGQVNREKDPFTNGHIEENLLGVFLAELRDERTSGANHL